MQEERYFMLFLAICTLGVLVVGWEILTEPSDAVFGDRQDSSYRTIEVEIDGEVFEGIVRQKKEAQTAGEAPIEAHAGANFY